MLKSRIVSGLVAVAMAIAMTSTANAGKVYGNYGQYDHHQDGRSGSRGCDDVDIAVGTGVGGVVGGIIGHQFGKGSGNTAATIGGVILGGIVGNSITKDACKDKHHDAYYYDDAYSDAFNDPDEDARYEWNNPYTNNHGYVTTGDTYEDGYQDHEGPCREFTQQVYIEGRPETATGVACRQRDGSWRIVSGE